MEVSDRREIEIDNRRDILITEMFQNTYECMVCFEKVLSAEAIWHCGRCYSIFHSICIYKWALTSSAEREEEGNGCGNTWRCPGCQAPKNGIPEPIGRCFCGGVESPELTYQRPEKIPHSCEQICNSIRIGSHCSHPCQILCHPGPCPKCEFQVNRSCLCGKTVVTTDCAAASNPSFQCDQKCLGILPCRIHRCIRPCHAKPCGECPIVHKLECHCGRETKDSPCGPGIFKKFSCQRPCEKWAHCRTPCHPGPCSGGYFGRLLGRIESSNVGASGRLPERRDTVATHYYTNGPLDKLSRIFCYLPFSLINKAPMSTFFIGIGLFYFNDCPEKSALCPVMILLGVLTIIGKLLSHWMNWTKSKNPEGNEITACNYGVLDILAFIIIVVRVGLYVYFCALVFSLNLKRGIHFCNSNLLLVCNVIFIITISIGVCTVCTRLCNDGAGAETV